MDDIMIDDGDDVCEVLTIRRTKADDRDDETVVGLGWRVFGLTILTLITATKSTQEYLLIVTIFGMADEFKFGETECQVINETRARDYLRDLNMTGYELCSEAGRCSENSSFFLPDECGVRYTGQGTLYDVLAGPIYLIIQGVATVPLIGLVQGFSMRAPLSIAMFTVLWTLCSLLTAFVNDYWAVALFRFLFGIFAGPYTPLKMAYLAHIFPTEVHTIVFGIATYGAFLGYGISFLFVNVMESIGWRWCYIICGSSGLILALASCFMANPKGPHRHDKINSVASSWKQHRSSLRQIAWACMICVILANTASTSRMYVGSYNITVYLAEYFPEFDVAVIGLITIVAGFIGSIFGGWMGDRLRKISGIRARIGLCLVLQIFVLVISTLTYQTPLTALVILVSIGIPIGNWFIVVLLSIISDLTPLDCKAVLFAINFFFTHSIAGTVNLAVTPVSSMTSLRTATTLLCGTLSGISALFLFLPIVCSLVPDTKLKHETNRNEDKEDEEEEVNEKTPLKISYDEK